eukprot:92314_1
MDQALIIVSSKSILKEIKVSTSLLTIIDASTSLLTIISALTVTDPHATNTMIILIPQQTASKHEKIVRNIVRNTQNIFFLVDMNTKNIKQSTYYKNLISIFPKTQTHLCGKQIKESIKSFMRGRINGIICPDKGSRNEEFQNKNWAQNLRSQRQKQIETVRKADRKQAIDTHILNARSRAKQNQ